MLPAVLDLAAGSVTFSTLCACAPSASSVCVVWGSSNQRQDGGHRQKAVHSIHSTKKIQMSKVMRETGVITTENNEIHQSKCKTMSIRQKYLTEYFTSTFVVLLRFALRERRVGLSRSPLSVLWAGLSC